MPALVRQLPCLLLPLSIAVGCNAEAGRSSDTTFASESASQGTVTASGTTSATTDTDGSAGVDADTFESDAGTTAASTTGDMNCGEANFVFAAVPPNVVLVLDKSGSMLTSWDHDGDGSADITRWNSLYQVVEFVTQTFDDTIRFGAVLFPSKDALAEFSEGACVVGDSVDVPVGAHNSAAVLQAMPQPNTSSIAGATPTTAGVNLAIEELAARDPTIPRVMILVTDGAANCSTDADLGSCPGLGCELMEIYDQNLAPTVEAAVTDHQIRTFVVGIDIADELDGVGNDGAPEANTFQELNALAVAGGVPRDGDEQFYNTENGLELQLALEDIATQVVSCTVPLDPPPELPQFVEIEIDGDPIAKVEDCATEDGWVYSNPDGPYDTIELCGSACGIFSVFGTLDALYGCPPPE